MTEQQTQVFFSTLPESPLDHVVFLAGEDPLTVVAMAEVGWVIEIEGYRTNTIISTIKDMPSVFATARVVEQDQ